MYNIYHFPFSMFPKDNQVNSLMKDKAAVYDQRTPKFKN